MIEHELDHVFVGRFDGPPVIDRDEVAEWRFASLEVVERELREDPGRFTKWFGLALPRVGEALAV